MQYEEKVAKQQSRLERMNRGSDIDSDHADENDDQNNAPATSTTEVTISEEDLRFEEQEIQELELKKRVLEERVAGMEKDLGGLLR